MPQFTNFFENLKEAHMRLKDTVVVYDGKPYYVLTICDHKPDGVFRIYLDDCTRPDGLAMNRHSIPYEWYDEEDMSRGDKMDEWLEKYPDEGVIRKMMNSPKFSKFRPFPLGMCNNRGEVIYIERTPTRYTQQGLTPQMLNYTHLTAAGPVNAGLRHAMIPNLFSFAFSQMVMGNYPDPKECIKNLCDPDISNSGMAFNRSFSFVRGPVGLLFLSYKQDVVGYMPNADLSCVTLASKFKHCKEVVSELELFEDIRFQHA